MSRILLFDFAATIVFVAVTVAALVSLDTFGSVFAVVSIVLLVIGSAAFLWGFAIAVERSREEAIGVGGLYFLQGCAPRRVQLRFMGLLAVQIVVSVAAASIEPFTELAFGILVPMFGLGLSGLWGARNGTFPARIDSGAAPNPTSKTEQRDNA